MKTIKFLGLILLAFSVSLINQQKEEKEIQKQNIWVNAGIQDHEDYKNNILMVELENGK